MPFIGNKPSAVPLTSADIADSIITSAKIVDGTIVNADINSSAAITYSKLSLGTSIVNADVSASAAIALTKLASTGTLTVDNIQFPATAVPSANANNLDDYEEGSWTPVISDGTNNATMGAGNGGRYTKIGNVVSVSAYVTTSSLGSVSGNIRITGIPFTIDFGGSSSAGYGELLNITLGRVVGIYHGGSGANHFVLNLWDEATGTSVMQATEWSADGGIVFSITYRT